MQQAHMFAFKHFSFFDRLKRKKCASIRFLSNSLFDLSFSASSLFGVWYSNSDLTLNAHLEKKICTMHAFQLGFHIHTRPYQNQRTKSVGFFIFFSLSLIIFLCFDHHHCCHIYIYMYSVFSAMLRHKCVYLPSII